MSGPAGAPIAKTLSQGFGMFSAIGKGYAKKYATLLYAYAKKII